MEPCLFRHGKFPTRSVAREGSSPLQWSHVFSDMVRDIDPERREAPGGASMEPCLFRHGKRSRARKSRKNRSRLQWSHVFSDMVRIDRDR